MRKIIIPLAAIFSLGLTVGAVGCGDADDDDSGDDAVEDTQADDDNDSAE